MRSLILGIMAFPASILAQDDAIKAPPPPHININGHAEAKIVPDRATIHIAVQTKAANAAAAASENAQIQQRVFAALRRLGIAEEQITTANYSVLPQYRYEPNREPIPAGYRVNNTIVLEIRRTEQVGPAIDAALGAGANMISSLNFFASNTEAARREALGRAVASARADADVIARAAGGTLGALLEASVGSYVSPPPRPMMMRAEVAMAEAADTPVSPGTETLSVDVTTRWRFVAAPR